MDTSNRDGGRGILVSREARNVAIIPARGGSKGIPRKNLMSFCGKPLVAWSIEQALASELIDEIFVSSDDTEILEVAERCGAHPVVRPADLSGDDASSEDALLHTLALIDADKRHPVGLVLFLQATSPLRRAGDIDSAVRELIVQDADSLFSAAVFSDLLVWRESAAGLRGLLHDPNRRQRRQDSADALVENGSMYVTRAEILKSSGNRLGGRVAYYPMPAWSVFEIDEPKDVSICELLMKAIVLGE